jgi:hypothetical protein
MTVTKHIANLIPFGCSGVLITIPLVYNRISSSTIRSRLNWSSSAVGSFGPAVIWEMNIFSTWYLAIYINMRYNEKKGHLLEFWC